METLDTLTGKLARSENFATDTFNADYGVVQMYSGWAQPPSMMPLGNAPYQQPPNHPMKAPPITSPKKQIPSSLTIV